MARREPGELSVEEDLDDEEQQQQQQQQQGAPSHSQQDPVLLEGPLETRGPGVVGRWRGQFFQLTPSVLHVYSLEGEQQRGSFEGRIHVSTIRDLALDDAKGELRFETNQTKLRVRAANLAEWHEALADALTGRRTPTNGSSSLGGGGGGGSSLANNAVANANATPSPTKSPASARSSSKGAKSEGKQTPRLRVPGATPPSSTPREQDPEPTAMPGPAPAPVQAAVPEPAPMLEPAADVWVQVDTVTGLPAQRGEPTKYRVFTRWRSFQDGQAMEDRSGSQTAGGEPDLEVCVVRQQVLLPGQPGQRDLIISIERLDDGALWACVASVNEPSHLTAFVHPLYDSQGNPTTAAVRLKLKLARPLPPPVQETTHNASANAPVSAMVPSTAVAETSAQSNVNGSGLGQNQQPPRSNHVIHNYNSNKHSSNHEEPKRAPTLAQQQAPQSAEPSPTRLPPGSSSGPGPSPRSARANVRSTSAHATSSRPGGLAATALSARGGHGPGPGAGMGMGGSGSQTNLRSSSATNLTRPCVSSRIEELHNMHTRLQRERQQLQDKARQAEEEKIAKEAVALRSLSSKNHPRRDDKSSSVPVSDRLYMEHKELELRMRMRQEKRAAEEKEKLQESRIAARPARAASPGAIGGQEVGARLHALQAEMMERRQKKTEEHVANEMNKFKKVRGDRPAMNFDPNCHTQLHEDSKRRQEKLEKLRREKELREQQELLEKQISKSRPVNTERIDELFKEHGDRLKRNNKVSSEAGARELARARQFCSCGHHFGINDVRCKKCGARRMVETNLDMSASNSASGSAAAPTKSRKQVEEDLLKRQAEAQKKRDRTLEELRRQVADQVYATCSCGNAFEANFADRCRKCGAMRPEVLPQTMAPKTSTHAPEDGDTRGSVSETAAYVVNAAVALHCGCTKEDNLTVGLKPVIEALKPTVEAYREAAHASETAGEGHSSLRSFPSQRLFMDGVLMVDSEAAHQQCEPDPIRQVEEDLDALLDTAIEAQRVLLGVIGPGVDQSQGRSNVVWNMGEKFPHPRGARTALFAYNPGVKTYEAAEIKASVVYGPGDGGSRYRHLLDLARVCLVFSNCANLLAGLQQIAEEFEVVDIRNRYAPGTQSVLGERYVEVLVVLTEGLATPHVCEIRLQELCFFQAAESARKDILRVCHGIAGLYEGSGCERARVEYLARRSLHLAVEPHGIRVFRRHLARVFGSIPVVWRRLFGSQPHVPFQKFKEACQQLGTSSYQTHVVEYWQSLDVGRSGCISLFELDPASVILLIKLRERLLNNMPNPENVEAEAVFATLTSKGTPPKNCCLEANEFRNALRGLGFSKVESETAFACLDSQGGTAASQKARGPASITAKDVQWLLRLPGLVGIDAITLLEGCDPQELALKRRQWASFSTILKQKLQQQRPTRQRPQQQQQKQASSRRSSQQSLQSMARPLSEDMSEDEQSRMGSLGSQSLHEALDASITFDRARAQDRLLAATRRAREEEEREVLEAQERERQLGLRDGYDDSEASEDEDVHEEARRRGLQGPELLQSTSKSVAIDSFDSQNRHHDSVQDSMLDEGEDSDDMPLSGNYLDHQDDHDDDEDEEGEYTEGPTPELAASTAMEPLPEETSPQTIVDGGAGVLSEPEAETPGQTSTELESRTEHLPAERGKGMTLQHSGGSAGSSSDVIGEGEETW